jgi:hypothetical protein
MPSARRCSYTHRPGARSTTLGEAATIAFVGGRLERLCSCATREASIQRDSTSRGEVQGRFCAIRGVKRVSSRIPGVRCGGRRARARGRAVARGVRRTRAVRARASRGERARAGVASARCAIFITAEESWSAHTERKKPSGRLTCSSTSRNDPSRKVYVNRKATV